MLSSGFLRNTGHIPFKPPRVIVGHGDWFEGKIRAMAPDNKMPRIVGHRANSLRTIREYLETGVSGIEIDLILNNGSGLVVEHVLEEDEFLDLLYRTEGVRLPSLKILGYRIQRLLGNKVVLRPTLDQLVSYINNIRPGITLLLDLKTPGTGKALASFLDKNRSLDNSDVFVSSRYHIEFEALKGHRVKKLATLISRPLNVKDYLESMEADGVSIEYPYVDRELVDELHDSGFLVAVWTVNDALVAKHLAKIGVDIIITDMPRRIIKALRDDNGGKRRRMRLRR